MKNFVQESVWLICLFIVAIFVTFSAIELFISNSSIDMLLHDNYFTLPKNTFLTSKFSFIIFLTIFLNGIRNKFRKTHFNTLIIVSGIIAFGFISYLIRWCNKFETATLKTVADLSSTHVFEMAITALYVTQILIVSCLLIAIYFWRKSNYETLKEGASS